MAPKLQWELFHAAFFLVLATAWDLLMEILLGRTLPYVLMCWGGTIAAVWGYWWRERWIDETFGGDS